MLIPVPIFYAIYKYEQRVQLLILIPPESVIHFYSLSDRVQLCHRFRASYRGEVVPILFYSTRPIFRKVHVNPQALRPEVETGDTGPSSHAHGQTAMLEPPRALSYESK